MNLRETPEGIPVLFGEQLYLLPVAIPLKGLKVLRPGLHVGTWKKISSGACACARDGAACTGGGAQPGVAPEPG